MGVQSVRIAGFGRKIQVRGNAHAARCAGKGFRNKNMLQQPHRNIGAGLGIGEGMVVMLQMIAAGCCYGVQLVVGQTFSKMSARGDAGAMKLIIGIIHLIQLKNRFQAAFVKHAVMGH